MCEHAPKFHADADIIVGMVAARIAREAHLSFRDASRVREPGIQTRTFGASRNDGD
jgi:hypothetical protein